ncbi:hypothetical protein [Actinocatenispora rupis]|uniref:Uncharacterized protein n=1 Tax=Actinocatenispora rupis TaxID=519421 RepID=A0A8J3J2S0_9ACTN|nr:hypothetical protein [Actinocatenispora rupis]GID10516.1 hypothetical protein Aru02nite_14050 [Actinocatenispora rupis]
MNEDFAWWLGDGDWYDRRQKAQIEELNSAVDGAYRQSSQLRSRLARIEGDLQSKVNRIAAAFDAFVELSDVRAELAVYTDPAIVRHQVRLLLAAVTGGGPVDPPELPEVGGYWLVPAARALYAQLVDDHAAAAKHTEQATELDAGHAKYFLTAALRLAGPVDLSAVQLAGLLPTEGRPVTYAARALWRATAAGAFGRPGQALLATSLESALGQPGVDNPIDPWLAAITGSAGVTSVRPAAAATTLGSLRQRLTPAEPPADVPADDGDDPVLTPLRDLLRALVDEGHAPERPLLRKAEQLRSVVESGLPRPEFQSWDAAVGSVADLVRGDIFGTDTPGTRPVAVRAAAPWLSACVETIAGHLSAPPESVSVRVRGRDIRVTADGADPAGLAALRNDIDAGYQVRPAKLIGGLVTAVVGLAATVAGFAGVGVGLAVVGLIVLVVGGIVAIVGWRESGQYKAASARERADMDRSVEAQTEAFRSTRSSDEHHRERVAEHRAALAELLG